jgi:hypothetical protein
MNMRRVWSFVSIGLVIALALAAKPWLPRQILDLIPKGE